MLGARSVPQAVAASLSAILCLSLVLFLIAATIVLALIPVYTQNRAVASNSVSTTSKEITYSVQVEQNDTVVTGRRRRATGDLYEYVGGQLGSTGLQMLKEKLLPLLPSNIIKDITMSNVSIGYNSNSTTRRRRGHFSKRATYVNYPIVLVIKFFINYVPTCLYRCQVNQDSKLQTTFKSLPLTSLNLLNVPIYINGVFFGNAPRIQFKKFAYISSILPGFYPSVPTVPLLTATLSTTATTTVTQNVMG